MKKDLFAQIMSAYGEFIELVKDIYRLGALQGHLGWDQETIMPPKGAEVRGEILAWLAMSIMVKLLLLRPSQELGRILILKK